MPGAVARLERPVRALIVVDAQYDFMPGGSLAVPEGDKILDKVNYLLAKGNYDVVVFSQDWHPQNHLSFASNNEGKKPFEIGQLGGKEQVMWPDHCVQGSHGAKIHARINIPGDTYIQQKGTKSDVDSYSAFADNNESEKTGLDNYLKDKNVTQIDVCGLATEFCVKYTALDAVKMLPGARVSFIEDASCGLDPKQVDKAKLQMQVNGINIVQSHDVIKAKLGHMERRPLYGEMLSRL